MERHGPSRWRAARESIGTGPIDSPQWRAQPPAPLELVVVVVVVVVQVFVHMSWVVVHDPLHVSSLHLPTQVVSSSSQVFTHAVSLVEPAPPLPLGVVTFAVHPDNAVRVSPASMAILSKFFMHLLH
jgi:hypothetical protein